MEKTKTIPPLPLPRRSTSATRASTVVPEGTMIGHAPTSPHSVARQTDSVSSDAYNARQIALQNVRPWTVTELSKIAQDELGLLSDGKCGPVTLDALAMRRTSPAEPTGAENTAEPHDQSEINSAPFDGPLKRLPRTRSEVRTLFGYPGTVARPDRRWRRRNIVKVKDLPGYTGHVWCHQLAEPYLREAMRRVAAISGHRVYQIGGHSHRYIRRDPRRALSLHSWGIAIDINQRDNGAKTFNRGSGPIPWSEQWRALWPQGVDRELVEALESAGWTWGGVWGRAGGDLRARAHRASFFDPMHFELRAR